MISSDRRAQDEIGAKDDLVRLWSFEPDGGCAAALSGEVNRRLFESLSYVFQELGGDLGCEIGEFDRWIARISEKRPDPLVHVLFHTLVTEVVENGDMEAARATARRLLRTGPAPDALSTGAADADGNGRNPIELYRRFADLEENNRLDFVPMDPEEIPAAVKLFEDGLRLIDCNDPELGAEFRALVAKVLLVGQAPGHLFTSGAASCFQNWGALLVNPATQRDALHIVELIAHEATHLLLFALALDEPLVTNPPDQLHYSPLREAPRSMDGVFHATIVSARVARALLRQADAPGASAELREIAIERACRSAEVFREGVGVIVAEGELTPLGSRILTDCREQIALIQPRLLVAA